MSSDTSPAAHRPVSNRTPVELAGAIYGTILVTALIAALSEDEGADPLEIGAAVILSTLVFWLAHVYARLLAIQVSERRLSIAEVRDTAVEEWPMVQSVALPVAVLVLAPVGSSRTTPPSRSRSGSALGRCSSGG
jgi:hypothetical protein